MVDVLVQVAVTPKICPIWGVHHIWRPLVHAVWPWQKMYHKFPMPRYTISTIARWLFTQQVKLRKVWSGERAERATATPRNDAGPPQASPTLLRSKQLYSAVCNKHFAHVCLSKEREHDRVVVIWASAWDKWRWSCTASERTDVGGYLTIRLGKLLFLTCGRVFVENRHLILLLCSKLNK